MVVTAWPRCVGCRVDLQAACSWLVVPKQDFSADAWALGLCFLHLLTGNCPYEEVLESVVCPASLRKELYAVWSQPAFTTLSQALAVDDTHILPNTLYRMCVMLGVPTAEQLSEGGYDASPVWKVLVKGLCTPGKRGKPTAVRQQYDKDCARCSLAVGDHPLLVRARRRMAAIPNSQSLLHSLLNFFPQQRLSLSLLPRHAMFL
jgi:serine/threonine protein kinase